MRTIKNGNNNMKNKKEPQIQGVNYFHETEIEKIKESVNKKMSKIINAEIKKQIKNNTSNTDTD